MVTWSKVQSIILVAIQTPAPVEVRNDGSGEVQTTAPTKVQAKVKDQPESLDEDKALRKRSAAEGGGSVSMKGSLKKWKGGSEAKKIISRGNNLWYKWARYTATTVEPGKNCYVCSMASEEKVVIPVPWRSEDSPQHDWDYKDHISIYPYSPFECMMYMGSHSHRNMTFNIENGISYTLRDSCKLQIHTWPETDLGEIRDYTVEEHFNYECFDMTDKQLGGEDVGVFEGNCNRTWTMVTTGPFNTTTGTSVFYRQAWELRGMVPLRCVAGQACTKQDKFIDKKRNYMYADKFPYLLQDAPLADLWWACGKEWGLRNTLPPDWTGKCARVAIMQPAKVINIDDSGPERDGFAKIQLRNKREVYDSEARDAEAEDQPFAYGGYLNAIGQPRGIPQQYKARDEVTAGFESIFPWVGLNKNVEWINYIYYNQQRFINYTSDALKALGEQLDATSRMTMQNRMVLDWMLAKEGGVCAKIGSYCCTFIPNNTAPDGNFTIAMNKLFKLRNEMKENAGPPEFGSLLSNWFKSIFGSWGAWFASVLGIIALIILVFCLIVCCLIPCFKSLAVRAIASKFTQMTVVVDKTESRVGLTMSHGNDEVLEMIQVMSN